MQRGYERTLGWALLHPRLIVTILLATIGLNIWLYIIVPKGFFPQQDTGRMIGGIQADQSTSFQAMKGKFSQMMDIVGKNPAVDSVVGFTGGRQTNSGFMFVSLKPKSERKVSADQVIQQLRAPLGDVAGARTFLQAVQDIRVGGRQSNAQYQFTLLADSTADLYLWGPKLTEALQARRELADVNSDQQQGGLEAMVTIDRATAARFGIKPAQIDNTLVRRVRPAPGVDHLQPAEPVSRRDGSRAAVLAEPGDAQADLHQHVGRQRERRADHQRAGRHGHVERDCGYDRGHQRDDWRRGRHHCDERGEHRRRLRAQPGDQLDCGERQVERVVGRGGVDVEGNHGAVVGDRELRAGDHAAVGESPEPVRGLDDLVQSAAGRVAVDGDRTRSTTRWRRSACRGRSTAVSRARRRRSSSRCPTSRS